LTRSARGNGGRDAIRMAFRVSARTHGELHVELTGLAPGERAPRLLFLAQLGLLLRASIAARGFVSAPATGAAADVNPNRSGLEAQEDLRRAVAELDLSSFNVT
jgi:hypothetical protein